MLNSKQVYSFISSMKTGLVLLGLIGVTSAIGSGIMPDHFFHTKPFQLLLILLFINMGFCTFNQISRFIKSLHKSNLITRFWSKQFSLLILHLGIVLILIGGTINAYYGQSTQVRITEGDTIKIADVIATPKSFSLQVNEFNIEFYEDGSPSQYYSDVNILDAEGKVENYLISVNQPLNYQGIKAYQHSYGHLIKLESQDLGSISSKVVGEGQVLAFKNTHRSVKIYKYIPNFDSRYGMNTKTIRPDNPKIVYSVYEHGNLLGIGAASFGEEVLIDEDVYVIFSEVLPYTVLTIKSDPGLPWTGAGGILLMVGVCLVYYFASKRKSKIVKTTDGGIANDTI